MRRGFESRCVFYPWYHKIIKIVQFTVRQCALTMESWLIYSYTKFKFYLSYFICLLFFINYWPLSKQPQVGSPCSHSGSARRPTPASARYTVALCWARLLAAPGTYIYMLIKNYNYFQCVLCIINSLIFQHGEPWKPSV